MPTVCPLGSGEEAGLWEPFEDGDDDPRARHHDCINNILIDKTYVCKKVLELVIQIISLATQYQCEKY